VRTAIIASSMTALSEQDIFHDPWPPLSYPDFAATQHLLHMGLQAVGKLKLKSRLNRSGPRYLFCLAAEG